MKHARLSPSASDRWFNCPGSILANSRAADETNEYANEGIAAHELLEVCMRLGVPPEQFLGHKFHDRDATEDMIEAVALAVDWVNSYITRNPGSTFHVEKQIKVWEERDDCWGTSDLVVESKDELTIIDYKHGAGVPVEAEGNSQLLLYLIGRARELKRTFKRFRIVIIQPRARHDEGPMREMLYDNTYVTEFKRIAIKAAKATDDPKAPRVAGDHCRWCRASKTCKTLAEENMKAASAEFTNLDEQPDITPRVANEMTIEQIAYVLKHQARIETWLKAVAGYATELLRAGNLVPGFKLVRGRNSRDWTIEDEEKLIKTIMKAGDVTLDQVAPREVLSVAKTETLLKKKKFKETLEKYVLKTPGQPHIAPESDPRAAVTAGSEFIDSALD